jgi:hypothetical protein
MMDIAGVMIVESTKAIIFACRLLFGLILPALIDLVKWSFAQMQSRPSVSYDAAEVLGINQNMLAPTLVDEELTPAELFQGGVVLGQDMQHQPRT